MKTPAANRARLRLGWIACGALVLAACTGPGLEPPGNRSANNSNGYDPHTIGKNQDAGASFGNPGMGTGAGGQGTNDPDVTGSSGEGSGGKAGGQAGDEQTNPPVQTQDAGVVAADAGDEDAGQEP